MNVQSKDLEHPPKAYLLKFLIRALFIILIISVLFIGFNLYCIISFLATPGSEIGIDLEIVIPSGSSFHSVAEHLKNVNAITDVQKFEILAKWKGVINKIKSGRFFISTGWTPLQVLDQLVNGKPIYRKITIPEGWAWWQIAKLFEDESLVRFEDFKTVIHDPEFLQYWGIPFHNAEGFLFPDTYLITQPIQKDINSAKIIIGILIRNFWYRTAELWPDIQPKLNNTEAVRESLILASIIEKETSLENERSIISGVFANRLIKKIPLQACPTVIYGLGGKFEGRVLCSQFKDKTNKYNTYAYRGLPPGPISSPGIASIKAALNPAKHNYYYFVSRGDGSHVFSNKLEEHNKMAKVYRSTLKNR